MFADPEATPVTTPELLTDATPVLLEVQVPPVAEGVKVVVEPTQTELDPVIVGVVQGLQAKSTVVNRILLVTVLTSIKY
jgi:hypothetical protein